MALRLESGEGGRDQLARATRLLACHLPVSQEDDPVGDRRGAGIVRDHDDGLVLRVREFAQKRQDLGARAAVEVAGGLIGQDQLRLAKERACDRDALLLAAGELGRQMA